jgi:recombination protein RecT
MGEQVNQSQQQTLATTLQEATVKKEAPKSNTIEGYIERMKPVLMEALPKHMDTDRLARIALTCYRTNEKLRKCEVNSFLAAIVQCSQLGLEPNLIGHAYLVPYGNQVQFIIGYKGMLDLARRSGNIASIAVRPRYEKDIFTLKYTEEKDEFLHVPWDLREDDEFEDGGKFLGAYLKVHFKDGSTLIHYIGKNKIDKHRAKSKTGNFGPWKDNYEEMALKTVIRDAFNRGMLPVSIEFANKISANDETVKADIKVDMSDVPEITIEATYEEVQS